MKSIWNKDHIFPLEIQFNEFGWNSYIFSQIYAISFQSRFAYRSVTSNAFECVGVGFA